jgi:hypothetical protein
VDDFYAKNAEICHKHNDKPVKRMARNFPVNHLTARFLANGSNAGTRRAYNKRAKNNHKKNGYPI